MVLYWFGRSYCTNCLSYHGYIAGVDGLNGDSMNSDMGIYNEVDAALMSVGLDGNGRVGE